MSFADWKPGFQTDYCTLFAHNFADDHVPCKMMGQDEAASTAPSSY